MKSLYPEIEPFHSFLLETDSVHQVYVEQCGNAQGFPVIFLHGGPCSGCRPDHRRFFDPERYHIILMDQRGCGRSEPFGELQDNTTQELIDDMERIRQRLHIERWLLFGGSWGGALALLYAQQHRRHVAGMVIRGVFLARQRDLDWFIKDGAGRIYPEQWQALVSSIPESQRADLLAGLCDTAFGADEVAKRRMTRAWMAWGGQTALGADYQADDGPEHITENMVRQVQMEMHFAKNRYFIAENQILERCAALQNIPTVIVHGRNDLVCPMEAGYSLANALPEAEYIVLPAAGHVAQGKEMIDALVSATDRILPCMK
ncbi:prolyl aminopeptidase [Methylomarinum sp. Ch1-1]|uniref:Proline iminopeptidase n=1 Tax=Methylomarinum roseum TaxID=3067653 RepID=A0AAU7NXW9_9GAMM|nr:prolyl aminopeptidase [Methylomarinum sp. Ch1-1]MDP4522059.1 prolyl aminopeptidase [Methylomarinum sp. Ch1-1]